MSTGYYIDEPKSLSGLMASPGNHDFAVAIFSWLINEVKSTLGPELGHVELEIIRVTYLGSYPAIGVGGKDVNEAICARIESTIEQIVATRPASDLISFLHASGVAWSTITSKIMKQE